METFKVKYKGQLADAIVTDNGMYAVQLPTRKGDRGTTYTERIVRRDNKWEFSSREDEHPDYSQGHHIVSATYSHQSRNRLPRKQPHTFLPFADRYNLKLCRHH